MVAEYHGPRYFGIDDLANEFDEDGVGIPAGRLPI